MKVFEANFATIMIRYYLLVAVIVAAFFTGIPIIGLLAIPIFLSALLGVSFRSSKRSNVRDAHDLSPDSGVLHAA